jgi:nucleoid-associated protein YgaU
MGLFSFMKEAGQKLFTPPAQAATPTAAPAAPTQADVAALNQKASKAIEDYIKTQNLPVEDLSATYDGASQTVTVRGKAKDQATREKVVLCCGNVQAVAHVDDQMTVEAPAKEAKFYTVKSGDTLSKISKEMYGDANKYNAIFEANKPMLSDPNKIYPGQTLRIPEL